MKIGICGHFGADHDFFDGQTIKTRITAEFLSEKYGVTSIIKVDTYGGRKKVLSHVCGVINLIKKCQNVIILPAYNGLKIFAPLLVILNKIYHKQLHYIVIGGWLPKFLPKHRLLKKCLMSFDYIYVETNTMKQNLERMGFKNVVLLPNYKKLKKLSNSDLCYDYSKPYRLCILSRITPQKGIRDAVLAVKAINQKCNEKILQLDIYGQIDSDYRDSFMKLIEDNKEYVTYGEIVPFEKTVEIIKNYFLLLFPTKFYTEGIPGTILDAYAAGVPVISSKWQSFHDLIVDGKTGLGYDFSDKNGLFRVLNYAIENPDVIIDMKEKCLEESQKYVPENAMIPLTKRLEICGRKKRK